MSSGKRRFSYTNLLRAIRFGLKGVFVALNAVLIIASIIYGVMFGVSLFNKVQFDEVLIKANIYNYEIFVEVFDNLTMDLGRVRKTSEQIKNEVDYHYVNLVNEPVLIENTEFNSVYDLAMYGLSLIHISEPTRGQNRGTPYLLPKMQLSLLFFSLEIVACG